MHRSLEMTTEPSDIEGKGKLINKLLCFNLFVIQSISLVYIVNSVYSLCCSLFC